MPHGEKSRRAQLDALYAEGIKAPLDLTAGWDELAAFDHPECRPFWSDRLRDPRIHRSPDLEISYRRRCAVIHLGRNTAGPANGKDLPAEGRLTSLRQPSRFGRAGLLR